MYSYPYLIRKLDKECPPGQCGSRNLAPIALKKREIKKSHFDYRNTDCFIILNCFPERMTK